MIDRPTIERIKDAADIVDVVSEFVSLRRVGANYRGLCPFHDDHSPSFYVSPARRSCHCFVCGEGGDAVGFIMKHEQLNYPEALRWLANRYHIEIQERHLTDEQRKEQSERESMYIVNQWAADYFKDILHNDIDGRAIGMQYFRQRGLRDDIIEKFQLGFALADHTALLTAAKSKGYNEEYLLKTGLCIKSSTSNRVFDRFAGRAIFPWIGLSGKVVAFGGRVLDSRTKGVNQKYVNSPDSEIYHKERELYGLFQAKKAIAKQDLVYMVEGYTDVLAMHQCGIENVVANSGTALSTHQVHALHRFTTNIVLIYDGDAAGIKAAMRGTDMLLAEDMNVKVLVLPDGDDPDSFARKHTSDEVRQYFADHATDFVDFKIRLMLDGVTDPIRRSEAITSIIQSVSRIADPIKRTAYVQMCSSRLGMSESILIAKLNEYMRAYRDEKRKEEERQRRTAQQPQQDYQSTGQWVNSQPVTATPQPAAPQDGPDLPPPDIFLPDEAFTPIQQGGAPTPVTPQPAQPTPLQPVRPASTDHTGYGASATVQDSLITLVINHGTEIVYKDVESDDGTTIDLTLAQYVQMDMQADNLRFDSEVYNTILSEIAERSASPDFDPLMYATGHADYDISSTALRLTAERVILSKSNEVRISTDVIRDKALHLLLEMRLAIVTAQISQVKTLVSTSTSESDMFSLMKQLTELQTLRTEIARRLGLSLLPK